MEKKEDSWIEIPNHCSDDKEEADHFADAVLLTQPTDQENILNSSSICYPPHPYNNGIDSSILNEPSSEIHRFGFLDNQQQNHLSSSTSAHLDNLIPPFSFSTSTQNNHLAVTIPENSMTCVHHQTSSLCYYCLFEWESISKLQDVNYPHNHNATPNNSFINSRPIDVIPIITTDTNSVPNFRYYGDDIGAIFRNTNTHSNGSGSVYSDHSIVNYSASCSRQERVFMNVASLSMKKKNQERWTADEHMRFLAGLRIYGRGYWKSISRDMVITKSATQVASHAQKFFQRQNPANGTHWRPSIHDMNTVDDDYVNSLLAYLHNRPSQPNSVPLQIPKPSRPPAPPSK